MANYMMLTGISKDREQVMEILERIRYTVDAYGDYYQRLLKFHRFYLSANERSRRPEPPDVDVGGEQTDWRARIFVPYSFGTIETAVPRLVFSLFGQRPFVRMVGRDVSDHENASKVTSLLDYDMERAEVDYKSILSFKSFLKYGITIGRVTYKREIIQQPYEAVHVRPEFDPTTGEYLYARKEIVQTTRAVKKFDGPWFEPVSVFNFFPDPLFYEIEDMRYVGELQLTSISALKQENENYRSLTGKDLYKNLDDIKGLPQGQALQGAATWLGDPKEVTAEVFGYGSQMSGRFGMTGSRQLAEDEVWLIHYWQPDRYAVLANGLTIIRDGDNPYMDQEVPYFAANCFPIEFEFFGQGMLHAAEGIQEELNAWRSIGIDQGKLNLMKPIAYDAEAGLTDLDFDLFPGAAVPVRFENGKPLAVPLFPRDTLPPEMWQMESMLLRDWQNALGINDYMIGGGPGQAGTASEAQMITAAASTRFKLQSFIGQERFLKRLAKKMFSRRQQYLDQYEVFRILGREGYDFPELGPEDIAGDYDFIPMGSVTGPNKEVERQQLIQFLTVAAGNPVMAQRINWEEILNELVIKFDFPFPHRFILPPNKMSLPLPYLERMLQMAIENKDDSLVDSLVQQMEEQMAMMQGGGRGGQNSGTMGQEIGGAGAQGAGQIAAGPTGGMPTLGSMSAQAMGGPGV